MTNPEPNPDRESGQVTSGEETLGAPVPEGRAAGDSSLQRDPDDWVAAD